LYLFFKAVEIIIICKTRSAGIKIIFQSTSSQPDFSETKAKLTERKIHNSIVFIMILFLVVLIFEIKLIRNLGFIGWLIDSKQIYKDKKTFPYGNP
jgi:predicted membrane-bound dolichyl-phosphate-mannose-protein mannosyltransferase